MNISEKDLHTKLRKMRSLLKFDPFIDIYHKSFLDFLQDSSRSSQYHVSKQAGLKRYLELVVDSVVRHVSMVVEQPNRHERCRFSPKFKSIVGHYPPKIDLSVQDWQEALKPLLDLQDKVFNTAKPKPCRVTQVMRDLLLHLVLLQRRSDHIAAIHVPESHVNETVTEWIPAPITEAMQDIHETNLNGCLSALLSGLPKTNPIMVVDGAIIDRMSSLLAFDYAETAARVRSVSDAQKLIDLIDLLMNNECFLSQCGPDAAHKAVHLASKIYARVPILPLSPFLNKPACHFYQVGTPLEFICQTVLISNILDHNYIFPALSISDKSDKLQVGFGHVNEPTEPIYKWLKRSSPNFITRIRVMLEIARCIRYIHSMDIALYSYDMRSEYFFLDSNLSAKFMFQGLFVWWSREASIYDHENKGFLSECTYRANISAFANLFDEVCFNAHNEKRSNRIVKHARQLIERCRVQYPKRRPTMEGVVEEMETWNLT
ncbi:hypothetical protein M378DRAFT_15901 [Amanita muscaria Koide BX008]|uniref:Protein kinase domain-containing protein n=1 Tax=Amanita muscaria (strain Koide BX008) TaxID=946122 RepID=A0A0C2WMK3_AMAMK|nr:hypothetical protein M378DRAFT_15901 [Amanita muscaria Koide BX008]